MKNDDKMINPSGGRGRGGHNGVKWGGLVGVLG